ncbi:SoxR reducing system RseC family protein [uncultured Neptuniibacter sp.]|uniref:SoxR reducing system RseC family protein n=1 Tax=uncultured Neptuniibacter sp. TaxID=502143 RepID=UPI00260C7AE4|nr:SoxR reducing system RseC family protein [uncultured Neptuniibacter sp.]
MIEENGKVVDVSRNEVWVETVRQSACASCAARNGCGHKLLASAGSEKQFVFKVTNPGSVAVKKNDRVLLGIEEGAFLKATLFIYLFPIFCMFLGALGAQFIFVSELSVILVSFLSLAASFLIVRYVSRSVFRSCKYQPTLIKVI